MLRMDQVHVIRHKVLVEGRAIRAVAREMRVSRNTVRKYLEESEPKRKVSSSRERPIEAKVRSAIEAILEAWKGRTTLKQRVTGTRVHRELIEDGHEVGVTTVRAILRERKRRARPHSRHTRLRPAPTGRCRDHDAPYALPPG